MEAEVNVQGRWGEVSSSEIREVEAEVVGRGGGSRGGGDARVEVEITLEVKVDAEVHM